jgi:hypothetical protein
MTDNVLPGFEDDLVAEQERRRQQTEARRIAASDPGVTGPDKDGRYTLTRTYPWEDLDGQMHKAVTVLLSPAEWAVLETHILADLGLVRGGRP